MGKTQTFLYQQYKILKIFMHDFNSVLSKNQPNNTQNVSKKIKNFLSQNIKVTDIINTEFM